MISVAPLVVPIVGKQEEICSFIVFQRILTEEGFGWRGFEERTSRRLRTQGSARCISLEVRNLMSKTVYPTILPFLNTAMRNQSLKGQQETAWRRPDCQMHPHMSEGKVENR